MTDLNGTVAFISGASRGIGAAAAQALHAAGAKVALAARSANAVADLAEALGEGALAAECDVADWGSVSKAIAQTEAAFGPVTLMVSNAGILGPVTHIGESDPARWAEVIDINVTGAYHTARAVLPGMLARGGGRIITIGSGAAHSPLEGWSQYCTSKAAALMLTRAIDAEHGAAGIVSINLSPGTVATDMQRTIGASGMNPVSQMNFADHKPAAAVGQAIVALAGPAGSAHAGQEVHINDLPISW